jgi:hypothetical protein
MKRNNVPKYIRSNGYDLCFKNMVMKSVEQTKGHEAATLSPDPDIQRLKQQKPELGYMQKFSLYRFKYQMKYQFYATSLLNKRLKFEVHLKVMCTSDAYEQFFFTVKIFTLQGITLTLQYNTSK